MILLEATQPVSDWLLFFGRFHPLVVHLPIGFIFAVVTLELLKLYDKISVNQEVTKVMLLISAISAAFSCLIGYFLSLEGGYNEEMLTEHRNQGIVLAILSTLAWIMKINWFAKKLSKFNVLYYPLLLVMLFVLFITGHHGGNLTHGESYLTENTPQPFRGWFGIPDKQVTTTSETPKIADINNAIVFNDIIKPIIKSKCENCHNPSKMKGDLRMDNFELLMKGGEHGKIVEIGKSAESELIKRILLPESNDDHMPPKGKNQISEDELSLLQWWIDNGATSDKKVSELIADDKIKTILNKYSSSNVSSVASSNTIKQDKFEIEEKIISNKIEPINEKIKTEITKAGGLILPFSHQSNYVEISFVNKSGLTDAEFSELSKNKLSQVLWLRLSNTKISDASSSQFSNYSNLTRLYLENTSITDKTIDAIAQLQNLEYLNIVNTQISDNGLKKIASMKSLKKLYVWQTKVSEKELADLSATLPNLKIEKGISEAEIANFLNAKPSQVSDDVYGKKVVESDKKVKK